MPDTDARGLLAAAAALAADHIEGRGGARVSGPIDEAVLKARLDAYDFARPLPTAEVAADVFDLLSRFSVRTDSPRYFGLFNPPALTPAVVGDLIAAAANPQMAVWSHNAAAAEIERRLVELFCGLVGWPAGQAAGGFTSGGSEANHTALLAAMARKYPAWADEGVAALGVRPAVYVSSESHLAWIKIARNAGLGASAVRLVPAPDGLSLTGQALEAAIAADKGFDPVLVVATAGTTAHGAIDDLAGMAEVGRRCGAHVHVDAAWAGAALIDPELKPLLAGIELADSVTLDAHKWLAVPMGAGMYLAREWSALQAAFGAANSYMPSASVERHDAYIHTLQWSRRFIGLKLFMALAGLGLDGYRDQIARQTAMGRLLRRRLGEEGWRIENDTPLPLVNFAPDDDRPDRDERVGRIARQVEAEGRAWISSTRLRGRLTLRACITSFETGEAEIEALIGAVGEARG